MELSKEEEKELREILSQNDLSPALKFLSSLKKIGYYEASLLIKKLKDKMALEEK